MTLPFPIQFASRGPQSPWFDAAAYVDLAAIADFNNNQYALPALGPELVTNGTFDTNLNNWTANNSGTGTSTWVAGAMQLVGNGAGNLGYRQQLVVTEAGKLYAVTFTQTGVQGFHYFGPTATTYVAGTQTIYFTATSASSVIGFGNSSTAGTLTIDNVSVREVILTRNAAALGANLVPGTGTNRSIGTGTATYTGGTLTLVGTNSTNTGAYEFPLVTQAGREYRITFTVAGASTFCGLWDQPNQSSVIGGTAATRAAGFHTIEFTATDADSYLVFGNISTGGTSTITGITAQELPAIGSYPKRSATFAEWFAFTAASDTARSYVDQSGTWRNSAYGVTNLVTWSNNQSNAVWTISGGSSVGSPVISLTGNMDAYPLTFSASSAAGLVQNLTGVTSSTVYTASVWVRCVSGTELVRIKVWDNTSDKFSSNFTVTTNWQRVSFTLTTGTTNPTSPNIEIRNASDGLARTVQVYQVQLEPGSAATAPLVTTANAVFGGVNAPRFDYRNSKRQLRLEDARTNSLLYSTDMTVAPWSLGANMSRASAGTVYGIPMWTFAATGSGNAFIRQNIAAAANEVFTVGYYATVNPATLGSGAQFISFSPSNRTITTGWVNTQVQPGLWRCVNTVTMAATNETSLTFHAGVIDQNVGVSFTCGGCQVERNVLFASDLIPTGATAVTRAIETARFSPLLEAVMQRAAASVVVRGRLDANSLTNFPRIVGGVSGHTLLSSGSSGASVLSYNGTTGVSGSLPTGVLSSPFGAGSNFDSAGRSAVGNGGTVGSDTAVAGDRSQLYLSRGSSIGTGTEYGHGLYDFVGISPERLPSATLQALAVPA